MLLILLLSFVSQSRSPKVNEVKFGESPEKNTPQLTFWCSVVGGKYNNKTRLFNLYLSEKALWKLQSLLQIVSPELASGEVDTDEIIAHLSGTNPVFTAWTTVNGDYNEFSNFRAVEESSDVDSTTSDAYDDIPI